MKALYAFLTILAVAIVILIILSNTSSAEGYIEGQTMLGPVCPVMRDPPLPECADRPFETRLALVEPGEDRVIKEFDTLSDGTFRVPMEPGTYTIRSANIANVLPYCSSNEPIHVIKDQVTYVNISCDTGIR